MNKYVLLENYGSNGGKLGISANVFKFAGIKAISKIRVINKKNLNEQVAVSIKNNTIFYKISVTVKKGINLQTIKDKIEENVSNNLLLICDGIPAQINVKVSERDLSL